MGIIELIKAIGFSIVMLAGSFVSLSQLIFNPDPIVEGGMVVITIPYSNGSIVNQSGTITASGLISQTASDGCVRSEESWNCIFLKTGTGFTKTLTITGTAVGSTLGLEISSPVLSPTTTVTVTYPISSTTPQPKLGCGGVPNGICLPVILRNR